MGVQARRPPAWRRATGAVPSFFHGLLRPSYRIAPLGRASPGQFQAYNRDSAPESRKVDDRRPVCRPASTSRPRGEGLPLNLGKRGAAQGPRAASTTPSSKKLLPLGARAVRCTRGWGAPGGRGAYFFRYFCPKEEKEAFRPRKYATWHNRPSSPPPKRISGSLKNFWSVHAGVGPGVLVLN